MSIQVAIHGSTADDHAYVTWASAPCRLESNEPLPRTVRLLNVPDPGGGAIGFRIDREGPFLDTLVVEVPAQGVVDFEIAGRFGRASSRDRDTRIVVADLDGVPVLEKRLMVRIRKNADTLSDEERDRFLSALVRLNLPTDDGTIPFLQLQNMHTAQADPEIHQRAAFVPWHRAYVLDLERRLQAIDPAVALPYWRFDLPAPNVFTRDFMGRPNASGELDFTATNPLINWVSRVAGTGTPRIRRYNFLVIRDSLGQVVDIRRYDPALSRAIAVSNGQSDTMNLGLDPETGEHQFTRFRRMEGDPHGAAHVSFFGQIAAPQSAPGDPLFFLLHCNVDRLWARWQWLHDRYELESTASYEFVGEGARVPAGPRIGDFTLDTMWPWNADTQFPRPSTAPGGAFPPGLTAAPSPRPTVAEMIDFQGQGAAERNLGFGYDDVECVHSDDEVA